MEGEPGYVSGYTAPEDDARKWEAIGFAVEDKSWLTREYLLACLYQV